MSTALPLGGFPLMDDADSVPPPPAAAAPASPAAPDPLATMDLVRRANAGDQDAVNALFTRYESRLRRWAHGRLPPASRGALETQDLVQETLIRVFRNLKKFEPRHPGAFRDYVWTALWTGIRDAARSVRRRGSTEPVDTELPADVPSPLQQAMGREAFERYEAAMQRLRPEEQEAIIARMELGLSHAEVAQALGKPSAAAAHMAVSRALVRLAEEMAHGRATKR